MVEFGDECIPQNPAGELLQKLIQTSQQLPIIFRLAPGGLLI
jgi:hypothetical protein